MTHLRLAILNKLEDSIDFLDMATRRFVGAVALPPHPHELVLSPDRRRIYASVYGDGVYGNNVNPGHQIVVVDLRGMEQVAVIETHPHAGPHAMAFHPDGALFVTCDTSNAVVVVDPVSLDIVDAIAMPGHGGHFMRLSADGSKAYVSNKDTAFMSVIDTATRTVSGRIGVAEGSEGIALSPDGKWLYAMSHMGSPLPNENRPDWLSFYVIDTSSDQVAHQVTLPDLPHRPPEVDPESRISASPDGRHLLISAFKWNAVVIVDAVTLKPLETLAVEPEPMHFDYAAEYPGMAFVASHGNGRISRIDLETLRIAETFPSSPPPRKGRPESLAFYRLEE